MRLILLASFLILAGCDVNVPLSQFDNRINDICRQGSGTYQYTLGDVTREFELHLTDDVDQIYTWCGTNAKGCTNGFIVYAPVWPTCPKVLAHELNHVFSNHAVDAH